jgi:hypothetical protein
MLPVLLNRERHNRQVFPLHHIRGRPEAVASWYGATLESRLCLVQPALVVWRRHVRAWPAAMSLTRSDHPCAISYVRPDFKIDCDSPLYLRMYWYSILMFIIYPLGIPTFFATLLYVQRTAHGTRSLCTSRPAGLHHSLYNIRLQQKGPWVAVWRGTNCLTVTRTCPLPWPARYRSRHAIYPGNDHKALRVRHEYTGTEDDVAGVDTMTPRQSVVEVNGSALTPVDHKQLRQVGARSMHRRFVRLLACFLAESVLCGQALSPKPAVRPPLNQHLRSWL